jgi:hypothetical protein
MRDTNSSLNSSVITTFVATSLYLGTMNYAYSTLFGYVGTPLKAASLPHHLCSMNWNSPRSFSGYTGGTSPVAAAF